MRHALLGLWMGAWAIGCTVGKGDPNGTDSGGSSETSGATTEPTTTSIINEPGSTTDESDVTGVTTGEPPESGCVALCQHYEACDYGETLDGTWPGMEACLADCMLTETELEDLEGCKQAYAAILACRVGLPCDELDEDFPAACMAEYVQAELVCGDPGCSYSGGGDEVECSLGKVCTGEPSYEIVCDAEVCACFMDGVMDGSCALMNYCTELIESEDLMTVQAQIFAECCGY